MRIVIKILNGLKQIKMNEYKLIKKLPFENSPEIGYISKEIKGSKPLAHYWMGNWFDPKLYPEYWEVLKQINNIETKDLKEGQKVYRIWRNGEKSLGVIVRPNFNLKFKALEDYPAEGQITKGYRYGLGDYKYELIEEVIKKDYEILEIHYKSDNEDTIVEYSNGIAVKRNDNISIEDTCTLKQFNKTDWEKYITITKVKRLSNNQIFKLGDLISDGNQEGKILRLRVTNDGLFQFSCSEKNGWCEFDNYNIIIKKDYEILSLARFCSIKPTITDVSDYGDEFIEAMLKCDQARIHSIKRLSDGEIFTIGDKFESKIGNTFNIKRFQWIIGGIKLEIVNDITGGYHSLLDIKHSKQPLFTTEDGVDIFEGGTYWCVNTAPHLWSIFQQTAKEKTKLNKTVIAFKDVHLAEEYIFYNSPVLSLKEVGEIYLTAKEKGSKAYTLVRQKLNL
jgi:hypothetical protein